MPVKRDLRSSCRLVTGGNLLMKNSMYTLLEMVDDRSVVSCRET